MTTPHEKHPKDAGQTPAAQTHHEAADALISEIEAEKAKPKPKGAGLEAHDPKGGWIDEIAFPLLLALLNWFKNRPK